MKLGDYELDNIYTGDARELAKGIPDASVDLIFCDPPYIKEYIHLYGWLAETAARILKPNGFLFAYAGVYWKWNVMRLMSEHMDYWFDMVLYNTGNSPVMWNKNVVSRYKSILVYSRKGETPKARVMALSYWMGGGEDKRYHTWGQDESSTRYYIDCFSAIGDIVFDPFVGGGTTAAMCKLLQRRWLAFEVDPATADVARDRMLNYQPPLFVLEHQQAEMPMFDPATGTGCQRPR